MWRLKSISSVTKEDYSLATKLQIIGVLVGLILFVLQVFRVPKFLTREHLINAAWLGKRNGGQSAVTLLVEDLEGQEKI